MLYCTSDNPGYQWKTAECLGNRACLMPQSWVIKQTIQLNILLSASIFREFLVQSKFTNTGAKIQKKFYKLFSWIVMKIISLATNWYWKGKEKISSVKVASNIRQQCFWKRVKYVFDKFLSVLICTQLDSNRSKHAKISAP